MIKKFVVEVEIPEDPMNILNASDIRDIIDSYYDGYDDVRYYPVRVDAKEIPNNIVFV